MGSASIAPCIAWGPNDCVVEQAAKMTRKSNKQNILKGQELMTGLYPLAKCKVKYIKCGYWNCHNPLKLNPLWGHLLGAKRILKYVSRQASLRKLLSSFLENSYVLDIPSSQHLYTVYNKSVFSKPQHVVLVKRKITICANRPQKRLKDLVSHRVHRGHGVF
jgi:hypothetical protein